jgi:hypothetical protein
MPLRAPDEFPRRDQRQPAEQGRHRRPGPQVQPGRRVLVDDGGLARLRVVVGRQVRDHQAAPGWYRGHQGPGDALRIVGVRHEMQDRDEQHCDRLVKPEHRTHAWIPGNPFRIPQVVADDRGAVHAVQHVPGVRDDHGIVVDVDHPAVRRGPPLAAGADDVVHAVHGGQPGADVEELPDPQVPGQVADGAPEEAPVLKHGPANHVLAQHRERPPDGLPIGREVVLPAEHVVVHPRDIRFFRTNFPPARSHGAILPPPDNAVIGTSSA